MEALPQPEPAPQPGASPPKPGTPGNRIARALWRAAFTPYDGLARLLCLPLRWLPESALPKTRFLRTESSRIGHLAIEPDIFLKEIHLGLRQQDLRHVRWVPRPGEIANACLLDYWRRSLRIHDRDPARFLLLPVSRQKRLGIELNEQIIAEGKTAGYGRVQALWGDRPPLLQLTETHRQRGQAAMARLGLPPDAWFVAVHNREPGFLPPEKYGADFRNADVHTLIPAMEEVVRRGGWCVRLGDPSMTPLPPLTRVIDYAHSAAKSDWLDVYLPAACRFFLGCTSGLALVASVFGRPVAQANATPLSTILFYGPQDLGIAKLYLDARSGRPWTFPEILAHPSSSFRWDSEFAAANIRLQNNSPEELLDLIRDMFDRLDERPEHPENQERERRFLTLLRPGHYSFGSPSRIAPSYLARHRNLLP